MRNSAHNSSQGRPRIRPLLNFIQVYPLYWRITCKSGTAISSESSASSHIWTRSKLMSNIRQSEHLCRSAMSSKGRERSVQYAPTNDWSYAIRTPHSYPEISELSIWTMWRNIKLYSIHEASPDARRSITCLTPTHENGCRYSVNLKHDTKVSCVEPDMRDKASARSSQEPHRAQESRVTNCHTSETIK